MTIPMRRQEALPAAGTVEDVLIRGNLSELKPEQRTEYYMRVCQSLGLNPLTRPFEYLTLNGKLVLYARRDCAEQLRKINGISIEIVSQDHVGDLFSVHVRAKNKDGRTDEDLGVVSLPQNAKGEAAANTILKAVTKAKRRVTLSISGLGFLDETEVDDIPQAAKQNTGVVISQEQAENLLTMANEVGADAEKFCAYLNVASLLELPASRYAQAVKALEAKRVRQ